MFPSVASGDLTAGHLCERARLVNGDSDDHYVHVNTFLLHECCWCAENHGLIIICGVKRIWQVTGILRVLICSETVIGSSSEALSLCPRPESTRMIGKFATFFRADLFLAGALCSRKLSLLHDKITIEVGGEENPPAPSNESLLTYSKLISICSNYWVCSCDNTWQRYIKMPSITLPFKTPSATDTDGESGKKLYKQKAQVCSQTATCHVAGRVT